MNRIEKRVTDLSAHVGGVVVGNANLMIRGVASLDSAGEGEIAYVEDERLFDAANESKASCVIAPKGSSLTARNRIEVEKPKVAFAQIAEILHPAKRREPFIHETSVIAESADVALTAFVGANVSIGEHSHVGTGTQIYPGVSIGESVSIGNDCVIHPNVVVYDNVTIGNRVILHSGVVIGADGFGYVRGDVSYHKFPQIGTVIIDDDVEIGANTTIDRGALGQTRIGKGTKLDNMVHVGHNCDIGQRVVIAAQTGISGSVTIADDCVIGGQGGFGDRILVKRGARIGSKAGILPGKIVRPG